MKFRHGVTTMGSKKKKDPVVRTITSLFSTIKIQDNPHKRTPEDYYKTMWLKQKHHTGIEIIAKAQHISKRAAADRLIGAGISRYMGELLLEHAANERANIGKR